MKTKTLSVIILTKDAEATLEATLASLGFASEIIGIDDGSIDKTVEILNRYKVKILDGQKTDFAKKRNLGLKAAGSEWVLYVDADEVVTPELAGKIKEIVNLNRPGAFRIRRENVFLGKRCIRIMSIGYFISRSLKPGRAGSMKARSCQWSRKLSKNR
jgi:glycosyltransferase involved in cell wall biosynthesis